MQNKNVKSDGKQAKNWVGFRLKSEFSGVTFLELEFGKP